MHPAIVFVLLPTLIFGEKTIADERPTDFYNYVFRIDVFDDLIPKPDTICHPDTDCTGFDYITKVLSKLQPSTPNQALEDPVSSNFNRLSEMVQNFAGDMENIAERGEDLGWEILEPVGDLLKKEDVIEHVEGFLDNNDPFQALGKLLNKEESDKGLSLGNMMTNNEGMSKAAEAFQKLKEFINSKEGPRDDLSPPEGFNDNFGNNLLPPEGFHNNDNGDVFPPEGFDNNPEGFGILEQPENEEAQDEDEKEKIDGVGIATSTENTMLNEGAEDAALREDEKSGERSTEDKGEVVDGNEGDVNAESANQNDGLPDNIAQLMDEATIFDVDLFVDVYGKFALECTSSTINSTKLQDVPRSIFRAIDLAYNDFFSKFT